MFESRKAMLFINLSLHDFQFEYFRTGEDVWRSINQLIIWAIFLSTNVFLSCFFSVANLNKNFSVSWGLKKFANLKKIRIRPCLHEKARKSVEKYCSDVLSALQPSFLQGFLPTLIKYDIQDQILLQGNGTGGKKPDPFSLYSSFSPLSIFIIISCFGLFAVFKNLNPVRFEPDIQPGRTQYMTEYPANVISFLFLFKM